MSDIGNKEVMAKNLAFYLERSGKTQSDVCDSLSIATSTFNNWIMGNKYPRIDKIEMLANYFGIQKSDLIEDKGKSATDDGLTEGQRALIETARSFPADKADLARRLLLSIVEVD